MGSRFHRSDSLSCFADAGGPDGFQHAKWMVYQAAWKIDREGARAARNEISAIEFSVAAVLQRVVDRAIQTHRGLGMTDDTPLSWFYRHERAARIYDGPDEVHKTVLARTILRQYGIELGSQGS